MRYVEMRLTPERGWFHRFDAVLRDVPGVTEEAIHQLNLLEDETAVILAEYAGDPERVDAALADHYDHAIAYQTSTMGDNTLVYAHVDPSQLVVDLLRIPIRYGLVIDWPIELDRDGGIRLTVVGEEGAIQSAFPAIPDEVAMGVVRTGEYRPETSRLYADLTDRQQEVLRVAISMGYYEEPRRVTYRDIAEEVGCTATTVGEHLRKVEARVLRAVVP